MRPRKLYKIYILGLLIFFALVYVRTAPTVGADWHHDPLSAEPTGKPNEYRLIGDAEPIFDLPASQLMQIVATFIEGQPRTLQIAGEPDENMATYMQRTVLIGYHDYITIKIRSLGDN